MESFPGGDQRWGSAVFAQSAAAEGDDQTDHDGSQVSH